MDDYNGLVFSVSDSEFNYTCFISPSFITTTEVGAKIFLYSLPLKVCIGTMAFGFMASTICLSAPMSACPLV